MSKGANSLPAWLLQTLPIPQLPWREIVMDFVEGLPLLEGKSIILTVVDRFTKFSHFFAISHPYTICKMAEFSLMGFSNYTGCLARLYLIGDVVFTSTFWQELFWLQETELNLSLACHPQSDG